MTFPRLGRLLPVESVEGTVEAMRERGLRASAARRLVLEALFAAEGPLDDVRETIRAELGFEARFSHFPIVGLCRACAAEAAD